MPQPSNPALAGFHILDLDMGLVKLLVEKLATHAGYGLGAKAPDLDCDSADIDEIDCSGLFRYLIHRATNGKVTPPDGSQCQLEWCVRENFKPSHYTACALSDGIVRAAFHKCDEAESIGHVALFYNGRSYESYGGNGPGSRPQDTPVLERLMTHVFCLA